MGPYYVRSETLEPRTLWTAVLQHQPVYRCTPTVVHPLMQA